MQQVASKYRVHKRELGFSLVEVLVAMGIFSFAIVAVFSLLSISIKSDKSAASDTCLLQMATTAMGIVKSQGFSAVKSTTATPLYDGSAPAMYFDVNGQIMLTSSGRPNTVTPSNSYYSCAIKRKTPSITPATTNMIYLQLNFKWPVNAPAANQQLRIINTSLANYD